VTDRGGNYLFGHQAFCFIFMNSLDLPLDQINIPDNSEDKPVPGQPLVSFIILREILTQIPYKDSTGWPPSSAKYNIWGSLVLR
jgi:hypothetical protein